MIEVEGLSKRFGDVQALKDVSFKVPKGQIVGFLGANGAGKTTTMDIICGCIGADAGTAKISGYDITTDPIEAKRRLGYLPDVPPLHIEMRVCEYIAYSAKLHKIRKEDLSAAVDKVIGKLSLESVRERVIGNLSKGYRQRVALAQALVHDPEVLVLDEPTEGLDPNQIVHIRELIKELSGQHTIILSSHILSEVQNVCDHIIIIHQGSVVRQGSYEKLVGELSAGHIYRLKVGRNAPRLVGALSALPGVSAPKSVGDQEIEFGVGREGDDQVLDQVAKNVVEGGFGMRELSLKTRSLEDVFFQITR